MLGAVVGPLLAAAIIWGGIEFRTLLLWTLLPGLAAAGAMMFLTKERIDTPSMVADAIVDRPRFPRLIWMFLIGVFLFGLGDFSRTFLVLLAAMGLGENAMPASGVLPVAVLLYAMHNVVSALAAYPAGHLGDRGLKLSVLIAGYGIGVATNVNLAVFMGSLGWLIAAIVMSGTYIAVEETLEKAVAAELLPRELRSLGFGILACVNAVGDMVSSLYVGYCLEIGRPMMGFGIAAAFGLLGFLWLLAFVRVLRPQPTDLGRQTTPEGQ